MSGKQPARRTPRRLPDPRVQPTLSVPEAGALLGMAPSTAYQAVKRGRIRFCPAADSNASRPRSCWRCSAWASPASPPAEPPSPAGRGQGGHTVTAPKVIGIDPALRSTGIACSLGWADRIVPPKPLTGVVRLTYITRQIRDACQAASLVVIEGPSYASRCRGHHERAGLWWLIRCRLHRRTPVAISPRRC